MSAMDGFQKILAFAQHKKIPLFNAVFIWVNAGFLEIRHNFLNGLELEQINKRVRHQHEKPRVGIVQIRADDLVDFTSL